MRPASLEVVTAHVPRPVGCVRAQVVHADGVAIALDPDRTVADDAHHDLAAHDAHCVRMRPNWPRMALADFVLSHSALPMSCSLA